MIDDDAAALLESGCALEVGTVDPTGMPEAARGWGVDVAADRRHLRVQIAAADVRTVANLRTTALVAVTATDVETLRSVQIKGRAVGVEECTPADDRRRARFFDEFSRSVETADGIPRALLERTLGSAHVAFTMTVEEEYDQTPGPNAGRRLHGTSR